MNNSIPHDSAIKHVSGESVYIDDMQLNSQLLIGKVVYSSHAHAKIKSLDLSAAKKLKGVHAVLCYKDIPGMNQMGPVVHDEVCLAIDEVICVGQAIVLIAAESDEIAIAAEKLIAIEYESLEAILDIRTAIEKNSLLGPARTMKRGDADAALKTATHVLEGELETGAQEHWYLETQSCLCVPGEDQEITAYSSTQHPSETQAIIAEVLGIAKNEVVVETRRMGGAFGGKETQGNWVAAWSALLCNATKRPVKIHLFRDDDQIITGKRHPYLIRYEVGFDSDGKISAIKFEQNADGGCATDLSLAILERAMLHADGSYYIPNMHVTGKAYKTNHPSNTAFRGFGGPQGMAAMEAVIDRMARFLKKDAADIRKLNFYGIDTDNITHYGQTVELNRLHTIYDQLMASSEYQIRRKAVNEFNASNEFYKKGIALTPVKFGISFTTSFLNQAGALVNIYKDGTVLVNHGGTEMGQGLNTKIMQIAAAELGISVDKIKVNATNTSKIPNTSATAASAGTDLNGMAVKNAIDTLKSRIAEVMAVEFSKQRPEKQSLPENIIFENDYISDKLLPYHKMPFADAMPLIHFNQVSLSATGFYRTPNIGWDKVTGWGKPFNYFAFGMCVSEVIVDTLTGFHKNLRTDILHDVGDSINHGIDVGQVEGGYIQGVGWCTTEEVKWNDKGHLLNHSPDTYKIPSVQDIPSDFRTELLQSAPNPNAIRKSKAVAEPPFMLACATWLAIKDAISAVADHELEPQFRLPATNEVILLSIEDLKKRMKTNRLL
ncbi:MAG: xanthine dehydrogenase molybdopterin binding subunit [Bacteroidota bacterium]|nr:xanthine dehydrogenase molybdopterin binding subunit [Bacteroidota bacterium]